MPQAQCRRADAFCAAQLPLCCTSQRGHSCWYIVVRMQKHCFFGLSLYLHAAPFGQSGDGGRREREREIIHIPWQFPIDISLLNCIVGSAIHGHGVPSAAPGIGPGALKCSRCRIGVDGAAASLWRRAFPQGCLGRREWGCRGEMASMPEKCPIRWLIWRPSWKPWRRSMLQTAETKAAMTSLEEKLSTAEEQAAERQGESEVAETCQPFRGRRDCWDEERPSRCEGQDC